MDTVEVRYVGTKPMKQDNVANTGAVWLGQGDVQTVPLSAWPALSKHSGVWRLASELYDVGNGQAPQQAAPAPTPAPAPAPAPAQAMQLPEGAILGVDLPELIEIDGKEIPLSTVVSTAHAESGLTAEAWNGLSDDERKARVEAFIESVRAEAAAERAKGEPDVMALSAKELKAELAKLNVPVKGNPPKAELQQMLIDAKKAGS